MGWSTHIFSFYGTFRRHFRTQIAPGKNKNCLKANKNNDWQRGRRWPPEPKVGVLSDWAATVSVTLLRERLFPLESLLSKAVMRIFVIGWMRSSYT